MLVLGALSAGLLGAVVGSYAIDTDPLTMALLATVGYLVGFLLARTQFPDLIAHCCTILLGVIVSLVAIDPGLLYRQLRAREWQIVLDRYESLVRGFLSSAASGDTFQTEIAVFGIGLTIWLVGSTSAWMLFRRGWVFWSVAIPGVILLTTLALERDRAGWPALVYLALGLAIAAGHTAINRASFWTARGIERPPAFGRRSILLGILIAAIAVGVGLSYSFDLDDQVRHRATNAGDRVANWVENRIASFDSGTTTPQPISGNYGAFSDQFKVGDGVPSGDAPIVIVQSNGEEYLAARRLNDYDGEGWKSTISDTQEATSQAPRIAFQPDQPMNIPRDQLDFRAEDSATITLLQPTERLLFTIDQHFSASESTLVRVGWEPIEKTYTIGQVALAEVPVDLRELVILLESSAFAPRGSSAVPELEDPQAAAEVARIRERLLATYPVATELRWADDGSVLLHLSGRLPVYSDIEAVFGAEDPDQGTYSVVGLAPGMSAADLQGAGTNYPQYITDTYLGLPDSVTQETRDLADQITLQAGATTAFDEAVAIQDYLRQNFTYQLDAGPAPDGRDIVDYFLFDSRVGRCDHYASSMAIMLRILGVPTRIVTGLAPVPYDPAMGGFVYRGRNAHAWVEVYFPGFGWIQFEPTPSESPVDLDAQPGAPIPTPDPTATIAPTPTSSEPGATPISVPSPTPTPLPVPATTDTEGSAGHSGGVPGSLLIGAGLALVAGLLGFVFVWRRRAAYSGMPIPRANYRRLQRLGGHFGIDPAPQLTPREYADRFGVAKPRSAGGAMRVAEAFTRAQYAATADPVTIAHDSESGWREARQGASDWRFWRRR